MDLSNIFQIVITYLLACMEVGLNGRLSTPLWSIRSHFKHNKHCSGGNLIRIDTDQCEAVSRQCKVKCNGSSTRDPRAKFSFVKIKGRKCIQFTDDRDGTRYALKVVNETNIAFKVQSCDNTTEDSFLFKEERIGKLYQYKHKKINRTLKLGVLKSCDENVALINTTKLDRRCLFRKLGRRIPKNG